MPGAVPRTSTYALTNVTAPYVLALAGEGFVGAIGADPSLAAGVSTFAGHLTNEGVGQAHGLPVVSLAEAGLP
jgi:alanine dehydrogenase